MRILYDVDTQNDFMNADGALPVPYAEEIKKNLARIAQMAQDGDILILGSVDKHFGTEAYRAAETELARNGGPFPNHCMNGTEGQKKIPETAIDSMVSVSSYKRNEVWLHNILDVSPQVVFEKQSYNIFPGPENPGGNLNIISALESLDVDKAILCGVATEYCVKAAALGVLKIPGMNIEVYVVEDAIKPITPDGGRTAIAEMRDTGANFITTGEVAKILGI